MENEKSNWDIEEKDQYLEALQPSKENIVDLLFRGISLLSDICQEAMLL